MLELLIILLDIQISYNDIGYGDPILMIGGSWGTKESWNPDFINELSKHHRVIIYDHRGTGNTTMGHEKITIERMAEDAYQLIKKLDIKPTILGFSMGGIIAQELALNHPESFDKLIILNSKCNGIGSVNPSKEYIDTILNGTIDEIIKFKFPKSWLDENPDFIESYKEYMKSYQISEEMKKLQNDALLNYRETCSLIHNIKNPTLILAGTQDRTTPIGNSIFLDKEIPNSKLIKIENGDHKMEYQFPEELVSSINKFVQ